MPFELSSISSKQSVGAFGEKAVEAELWRRGWLAGNLNASVENAEGFDILARKGHRQLGVRVKTCGIDAQRVLFANKLIDQSNFANDDFTIIVRMGKSRSDDKFYILPTRVVVRHVEKFRSADRNTPKKGGDKKKDIGRYGLFWRESRSAGDKLNYGFARKWAQHLEHWSALER